MKPRSPDCPHLNFACSLRLDRCVWHLIHGELCQDRPLRQLQAHPDAVSCMGLRHGFSPPSPPGRSRDSLLSGQGAVTCAARSRRNAAHQGIYSCAEVDLGGICRKGGGGGTRIRVQTSFERVQAHRTMILGKELFCWTRGPREVRSLLKRFLGHSEK